MPSKIFVKPRKPEFIVYKPDNCRLKAEGEYVDAVPFWQQRLNDKDVVIAVPPKAPVPQPAAEVLSSTVKKGK